MENQLPTQERSSEPTLLDKKNQVVHTIKDNVNYIYIVLMIIANVLCSLLYIEDGKIGLHYPSTVLGWVLWIIQLLLQTFIGVMILKAFRRQGVKFGHEEIKDTYEAYKKAITTPGKVPNPRSLKQYMKSEGRRDTVTKSFFYMISGFFVTSVAIGANWNNILSLVINTVFAIGFGIKTMLDAEEFVITELVIWYQLKIAELTNHKSGARKKEKKKCLTIQEQTKNVSTNQIKSSSIDVKMSNKIKESLKQTEELTS